MYSKIASRPGSRFCAKASIDGSAKRLGEIQVRRSLAVELCQYNDEQTQPQAAARKLHQAGLTHEVRARTRRLAGEDHIRVALDVDRAVHRGRKRAPAREHKEVARAIDLVVPDQPVNQRPIELVIAAAIVPHVDHQVVEPACSLMNANIRPQNFSSVSSGLSVTSLNWK